jgi:ribonuclease E
MAKPVEVAAARTRPIPADQLDRVREFTREPILLEGESADDLAPGSARLRAVEAAIDELDAGRETPSAEWRRRYSLLLGLERLLSAEPVELADGAELTEHQVDVLSGTLAALTAELEDSEAA